MQRRKGTMSGKDKSVGYGFVGQWAGGEIGWGLPDTLSGGSDVVEPVGTFLREYAHEVFDRGYLCRITIERVKDSRGRNITRKITPSNQ